MQDIVDKIDRAKALFAGDARPTDQEALEGLIVPALDFVGELVANSRRIAVALEKIAENTVPVELTTATAELVSGPSLNEQIAGVDWDHLGFILGQSFVNGRRAAGETV